jgi:hypothetical protein
MYNIQQKSFIPLQIKYSISGLVNHIGILYNGNNLLKVNLWIWLVYVIIFAVILLTLNYNTAMHMPGIKVLMNLTVIIKLEVQTL